MTRSLQIVCVSLLAATASARVIARGEIVERNGLPRRATVLEQGIPVQGLTPAEAKSLVILAADGNPLPGSVEVESLDEKQNPAWLRFTAVAAMPAHARLPITIETSAPAAMARFAVVKTTSGVTVETASYRLTLTEPGRIELSGSAGPLLAGNWNAEIIGDARGIIWGTQFKTVIPTGIEVEESSASHAVLLMKGYLATGERKAPNVIDKTRRVDLELRLTLNAFSPRIGFSWRLTNQFGHKIWLQRYALKLPLAQRAVLTHSNSPGAALLELGGRKLAITADFIDDLGKGAGMSLTADGMALLHGGIDMPPDGGYFSGRVPDIHRLFHDGMSRTFTGSIIVNGGAAEAAEALAPIDLVLPPQYYSDTKALPEAGDPVTFGAYKTAVNNAAEWLLKNQWRGTLWWGEWYREWDETRNMGVEEASNGHSPLAPLYHYWRTGDARFLACSERSAQYVWDVQIYRGSKWAGWMFHTRRHLFDELDWIHPRYQRATGGLIASHVFLNSRARGEIIKTIRNFHDKYFDENGIPHDWDKVKNQRSDQEDGVDTSNFMEALTYCYRETGDSYYLDEALKMSHWTGARWRGRGTRKNDDWNWNLANYALRGLYTLWSSSHDQYVFDLMTDIVRKIMANADAGGYDLKDGIGAGAEGHFAFYNAWISSRIARLCPDRDQLIATLVRVVNREVGLTRPDGLIALNHGSESGLPTVWTSYYDAKALVAYVPVLSAYLNASNKQQRESTNH